MKRRASPRRGHWLVWVVRAQLMVAAVHVALLIVLPHRHVLPFVSYMALWGGMVITASASVGVIVGGARRRGDSRSGAAFAGLIVAMGSWMIAATMFPTD